MDADLLEWDEVGEQGEASERTHVDLVRISWNTSESWWIREKDARNPASRIIMLDVFALVMMGVGVMA